MFPIIWDGTDKSHFCFITGKTIAGTTDSPTDLSYNPSPKEAEIQFILSEIKHYLSADVDGEFLKLLFL